ncbi:MAG: GNAT family N-acetyltransferase [Victivallales bacterium]|nr:GNAT family N-acetyltransferase [Victivallales bacterium]
MMTDELTITHELIADTPAMRRYRYAVQNSAGTEMSHAMVTINQVMYCGNYIPMLQFGGIGTPPHYRRMGAVRRIFNEVFSHLDSFGCYASMLHPFESDYYRRFGYERVATTVICEFPIANLDFLPRYSRLTPYDDSRLDDFLHVYDGFMRHRNLSFRRFAAPACDPSDKKMLYLDYADDGTPEGYILIQPEKHYDGINKMVSDNLHVLEFAYLTKSSMLRLLSFLRMFDGELESVRFHDIGFAPELEHVFRHTMNTRYEMYSDIAARVLDTAAMLKANAYPHTPGHFTLAVEDPLPSVAGVFHVEYGGGKAEVQRLDAGSHADLTVTSPPLSRLIFGYDSYDGYSLSYLDGVTVSGEVEDFLRAFPKRRNGNFNHF